MFKNILTLKIAIASLLSAISCAKYRHLVREHMKEYLKCQLSCCTVKILSIVQRAETLLHSITCFALKCLIPSSKISVCLFNQLTIDLLGQIPL